MNWRRSRGSVEALDTSASARTILVANPSADLYGSDRMMLETVSGLVRHGHRVVVAHSQDGPLRDRLVAAGALPRQCPAPVVRKANLRPRGLVELIGDIARGLPAMSRVLREVQPDVVYVNTVTIPFWLPLARLRRIPTVVHIHEAEASVHPVARLGLNAPTALASRIVYNSATSQAVGRRGPGRWRPSRIVLNGVSGPDQVVPAREMLEEGPRLVYVGRLSPRKGVDIAVRALARLRREGTAAHLTLVGAVFPGYEWYERELRELVAREHLEQVCRFAGFQPSVWPWLAEADIVVVPSRADESFGNTVVEAALSARPVIVADHTGLREARAGLSTAVPVPVDDEAALADAVERLVENWPTVREQALTDQRWASAHYAPSRYQDEITRAVLGPLASS